MNKPTSKKRLINRIDESHARLIKAIDELSPSKFDEHPERGEWSARDILAHIAQWEMVLLRFHLGGEPFPQVVGLDGVRYRQTPFSVINDYLYAQQRKRSAPEIKQFAERTHSQLMNALQALPAEDLEAPAAKLKAQGYQAEPLKSYVAAITYRHYDEHLDSIKRLSSSG